MVCRLTQTDCSSYIIKCSTSTAERKAQHGLNCRLNSEGWNQQVNTLFIIVFEISNIILLQQYIDIVYCRLSYDWYDIGTYMATYHSFVPFWFCFRISIVTVKRCLGGLLWGLAWVSGVVLLCLGLFFVVIPCISVMHSIELSFNNAILDT